MLPGRTEQISETGVSTGKINFCTQKFGCRHWTSDFADIHVIRNS
jgi:hypothetical protein